ncbi:hypothetical protein EB118_04850 [bacterium]|nr:hypothetical protein [bacterium]NDC94166.1 hypothetical protein [bacterium]NDD82764.1 hypothetical protein [bacterium]NDG29415.1 hypothetical protein [bacterium]
MNDWYIKKKGDLKDQKNRITFNFSQAGGGAVSFHDTFIKRCECDDGICKCTRHRESKRCDDMGKCEMVKIPENKLEVLEDYYAQTGGKPQFHGKTSGETIRVPDRVKKTALYAFKLKKMGFKGGLQTGWRRAKQLATKGAISLQDAKYMRAWFARHLYTSYPSYLEWKRAGRPKDPKYYRKHGIIAWLIWGGDAAFKWINSKYVIEKLNRAFNKNYTTQSLKK